MLIFLDDLFLLVQLPDNFGKFHVAGMSGTGSKDMSFQRDSDQRKIADHIQQFVPGGFILEIEIFIIQRLAVSAEKD